jgi:hypothetical protein
MFERMANHGDDFWTAVHAPFSTHDVTRKDVRALIRKGLQLTHGSYKLLTGLFNLPEADYKRFLNFLRKTKCQPRFQEFRTVSPCMPASARADSADVDALEAAEPIVRVSAA